MSAQSDRLYRKRSLVNAFNMIVSGLCAAFGLFWLIWILWTTLRTGLSAMSPDLFTRMTPPANGLPHGFVYGGRGSKC